MRIVLHLAASLVAAAVATTAQAAPAMPMPAAGLGETVTSVDWHPSTSHWDHHYHSNQRSIPYRSPTELERRIERGGAPVRNSEWSEYRSPIGGTHRY